MKKHFANLNEEISRMNALAGINNDKPKILSESIDFSTLLPDQKKLLQDLPTHDLYMYDEGDFQYYADEIGITLEDLMGYLADNMLIKNSNRKNLKEEENDIFGSEDEKEQEKKIETGGAKVELPTELKAAMVLNNIDEYTEMLFKAYTLYSPRTTGAQAGDVAGTVVDKAPVQKLAGAEEEMYRLIRNGMRPVTWSPEGWKTENLPDYLKQNTAKWLARKNESLISYKNGLTPMGKAQIEFLARMVAKDPDTHKDEKIFLSTKYANHISVVAAEILRAFYSKALIPIFVQLTKRQNYSSKDLQLNEFIDLGVEHALRQLREGKYDSSRENLGAWFIQVAKNIVINKLAKISDYKLDFSAAGDYLHSLSESGQPFKAKSKANPSEVEGNYDEVKQLSNGIWVYIYNDPMTALIDLRHDARTEKGSKSSPLSPRFLVDKNLFYKSVPKNISGSEGFGLEQTVEPEEVLTINKLPIEAKGNILSILNRVSTNILDVDPRISKKTYGAGLGREIFNNFLFTLLQYGKEFLVLKKPFEYISPVSGKEMVYPILNHEGKYRKIEVDEKGRLLVFDKEANKKVPVMPARDGQIPSTKWVWLSPTQDVMGEMLNKFNDDTLNKFLKAPENQNKNINDFKKELENNGLLIPYDKAIIIRKNLNDYLKKDLAAYQNIKKDIDMAVLAESKKKTLNKVRQLIREMLENGDIETAETPKHGDWKTIKSTEETPEGWREMSVIGPKGYKFITPLDESLHSPMVSDVGNDAIYYPPVEEKDPVINADTFDLYKIELIDGQFEEKKVATGTLDELNAWAKRQGLTFKRDKTLFGGYYVDKIGNSYSINKELNEQKSSIKEVPDKVSDNKTNFSDDFENVFIGDEMRTVDKRTNTLLGEPQMQKNSNNPSNNKINEQKSSIREFVKKILSEKIYTSKYGFDSIDEPMIPDAITLLSKNNSSIKFTNKNDFDNFLNNQEYFSASYSNCLYPDSVEFEKDCVIVFETGHELVAAWDDKNSIGYILPENKTDSMRYKK